MPVKNGWTNINLRIPNDLLNDIDERVKERVGIKRTGWILEAIQIAIQVCKGEV
jgi:metal-responsive CopG/Arc/MetJ family transcriptional regulator